MAVSKRFEDTFLNGNDSEKKKMADSWAARVTKRFEYETLRTLVIIFDALLLMVETENAAIWAENHPRKAANGIHDDVFLLVLSDIFCLFFLPTSSCV